MCRERAVEELPPEGVADPPIAAEPVGAALDEAVPAGEEVEDDGLAADMLAVGGEAVAAGEPVADPGVEEAPAPPFPAHPARARALAARTPSRGRRRAGVRGVVMSEL